MLLALLGTDPDSIRLAAAATSEGHRIAWIGDVRPEDAEIVAHIAPGLVDQSSEWESVLAHTTSDAVIVGRGNASSDLRAERLKRLAAETMPTLAVHPACDSVLPYYEIDMTRREMGCVVQHYNPVARHPMLTQLAHWVRTGHPKIGTIHQVTCERRLTDSSRANVKQWLARDVEPLAAVAGDIRRASAIGPRIDQDSFASLQVQMTCDGPASARWSVAAPAGDDFEFAITLVGERGNVSLRMFDDDAPNEQTAARLDTIYAKEREGESLEPFDPALAAIRRLAQATAETDGALRQKTSTWNDATRAMEVVDAVELSLEKGRTIDVHQQQLTEQMAFRGTMAAIGCGMLVVGFLVFLGVTLFGIAEGDNRRHIISSWPAILLALLSLFLLLQFVPMLISRKASKSEPASHVSSD